MKIRRPQGRVGSSPTARTTFSHRSFPAPIITERFRQRPNSIPGWGMRNGRILSTVKLYELSLAPGRSGTPCSRPGAQGWNHPLCPYGYLPLTLSSPQMRPDTKGRCPWRRARDRPQAVLAPPEGCPQKSCKQLPNPCASPPRSRLLPRLQLLTSR